VTRRFLTYVNGKLPRRATPWVQSRAVGGLNMLEWCFARYANSAKDGFTMSGSGQTRK
jgi:hypothetical protein